MNKPKINIQDLNLYYGKQHILKNINTIIPERQITVIMGPSGCGKTTLMKSLNRLTDLTPDCSVSGKIMIDGQNILNTTEDITKIRKKMGLLAQRPYPLPMSIYNNVAYGLRISGRKKRRFLDKRVEHYLRQVNLWNEVKDRLKEPAGTLSIGQQQRLCLARGLAVDPEIILADEPTSALDPISSQTIEEKFKESIYHCNGYPHSPTSKTNSRLCDFYVFRRNNRTRPS
jgi:phosphate transport system ATP-binding protein